jgi:hypothetical protein
VLGVQPVESVAHRDGVDGDVPLEAGEERRQRPGKVELRHG